MNAELRHSRTRALILLAAFLSFLLSIGLFFFGERTDGVFVGLWVPSILALGILIAPAAPRSPR